MESQIAHRFDRASERGQGLVEMLIALTVLGIAVGALIAVLVAGAVALQRTDQKGTATTLVDKQLELYRTFAYTNIKLSSSLLSAAGAPYTTAHASDATIPAATACGANHLPAGCLVVEGQNGETGCTTGSQACAPVQKTTINRSGTQASGSTTIGGLSTTSDLFVGMVAQGPGIPSGTTIASITNGTSLVLSAAATATGTATLTFNPAPDNRTYEIDTYITYYSPPSGVQYGAKQVLVIVRDPTRAGNPILARADSVFQPLTVATS
jgi:hypothetical protein